MVVGLDTADDAGVVRLADDIAVVTTADFITPPFDDPRGFGAIAAANALSDVWAMGGEPIAAINLCALPREVPTEIAREILAGAADKVREAGAATVGGHTVVGPELLFGLAVTGRVHPGRVWRNGGLRPGDALVLTKPLGCGLYVTAARAGRLAASEVQRISETMMQLNAVAKRTLERFAPSAATDVTGFGLAGHALGMARASGVRVRLDLASLPLHPEALRLAEEGSTCRGERENRACLAGEVRVASGVEGALAHSIPFDPQTSGGLLVGLDARAAAEAVRALRTAGVESACVVGRAEASATPEVLLDRSEGAGWPPHGS